jgi:hypothetical protein
LPFETFGEAAAFDLEVEVSCQCGRCVVIDGMAGLPRPAHHGHAVPVHHDPAPWRGVRRFALDLHWQAGPSPLDHGRRLVRGSASGWPTPFSGQSTADLFILQDNFFRPE